ncbi:hypothetical protein [Croceivirga thetidis]|uniref:Uncharacterized protein n=1 Tax=Croceivirga thetidis TaxID=2721623 RepID=A0ABX1GLV7_9FLAO|nr:hypothetical protein [Croceivirga thetidis]NKI30868.1 hypothetical protein [Croceivirga thetidis]
MERKLFILYFLVSFLNLYGQQEPVDSSEFFFNLALRDANHEDSLQSIDLEDEQDYWLDQQNFEEQLLIESKEAYQIYINGKGLAYQLHFNDCSESCVHSKFYYNRATFYITQASLEAEFSEEEKQSIQVVINID